MSDFHQTAKQGEEAGKPEALLTPAESSRLLQVITALNLVRMNLGMYPPGHVRITESLDAANAVIQAALSRGPEWIVGFPGDTVTFGEKAPERDKKNNAFKDFARSLNSLRIVSFRLRRGLKKDELLEFCRILSAKPADIWAMGKIEAIFARAGIKAVEITVVDADRFRLGERKAVEAARERPEVDARFWQSLLARLKPAAEGAAGGEGPADEERMERSEALRFLNSGRGHWPSAVVGYEKIFHHYLSQRQKGPKTGAELEETLAGINALILDLHPQLKQQLMEVIQRQFALHSGAPLSPEDLQCFPAELLREVLHQTNEQGAMISPVLVNLLKKMTGIEKSAAAPDQGGELSSADMETLLRREQYENYVPEEYDALLKKAAENASSGVAGGDPRFPLQELLKTLADAHVDFRICQFCRFLLEEGTDEADCLASARKLERSLPDLLRAGRFQWLTSLLETLRRHVREMPSDPLRQQASLLLRSLTRKETVARHVAPFIRDGKGDQAALRAFLVAGGSQNLSWLFDLLLDPRTALNETLVGIIQGFGREATEEALRRIPGRDPQGIVRLLTLIRGVGEKVDASSLKELLPNEDWKVRREVIRTLIRFDDPAAGELLRTTLQSKERDRVLEAVGLSCRYRVEEMLADLQALIRIVLMREEDAILNEWIVGEMMKTGHPAVVPLLEKIASARVTISPKHLTRLKRTLYRNLQRLPKEKIGKLLKMGSKSGDREIRAVCAAAAKSKE